MKLSELSLFYNNILVMLNAGVELSALFVSLRNSEKSEERKLKYNQILEEIKKGHGFAQTMKKTGLVPPFDIPIIESGEKAGKLPHVCEVLSKKYQLSAEAERNIRKGLTMPFLTFMAALFIPSFPDLFLERITLRQYLMHNFGILGAVILAAFFLHKLYMRTYYDIDLAKAKHNLFLKIPVLRGLTQKMALEKFTSSLALMLEAGLPIFDALKLAGEISTDHGINLASRRIVSELKSGKSLPTAFMAESAFTDDIKNSVVMGNESGRLPIFLERSATLLKTQVNDTIDRVSKAVPIIIYWSVVLFVAYTILSFYVGNMMKLNEIMTNSL